MHFPAGCRFSIPPRQRSAGYEHLGRSGQEMHPTLQCLALAYLILDIGMLHDGIAWSIIDHQTIVVRSGGGVLRTAAPGISSSRIRAIVALSPSRAMWIRSLTILRNADPDHDILVFQEQDIWMRPFVGNEPIYPITLRSAFLPGVSR